MHFPRQTHTGTSTYTVCVCMCECVCVRVSACVVKWEWVGYERKNVALGYVKIGSRIVSRGQQRTIKSLLT